MPSYTNSMTKLSLHRRIVTRILAKFSYLLREILMVWSRLAGGRGASRAVPLRMPSVPVVIHNHYLQASMGNFAFNLWDLGSEVHGPQHILNRKG